MATRTRTELKAFFETGDTPTETQFADLIDSVHNVTDDSYPGVTIDATPTNGSSNAVSSDGVFDALANKQASDQDLTDIAALSPSNDDILQRKAGAWTNRTPTQVTADLVAMIGDSGAGGVKGLVPAPAAGDAAANKFLKADGTWATAGSSGKLVWVDKMITRTSANGLGAGIANTVVWASVTIPANTLQAGDIIKIYGAFDSPTSASYTMGISLSSQATYGGTEYAFSGNSASRYLGTENVVFYSGGNLIAPYFNTGWAGGLNIRENAYLGASTNNIISPGKTTAFAATNALYARAQFYGTLGVAYECLFIYVEIIRP